MGILRNDDDLDEGSSGLFGGPFRVPSRENVYRPLMPDNMTTNSMARDHARGRFYPSNALVNNVNNSIQYSIYDREIPSATDRSGLHSVWQPDSGQVLPNSEVAFGASPSPATSQRAELPTMPDIQDNPFQNLADVINTGHSASSSNGNMESNEAFANELLWRIWNESQESYSLNRSLAGVPHQIGQFNFATTQAEEASANSPLALMTYFHMYEQQTPPLPQPSIHDQQRYNCKWEGCHNNNGNGYTRRDTLGRHQKSKHGCMEIKMVIDGVGR